MSLAETRLSTPPGPSRTLISALGWLTIAVGITMAILPRQLSTASAVNAIGTLLTLAGVIEIMVGASAAKWSTATVLTSGLVTTGIALIILLVGPHDFFTLSAILTVWLVVRGVLLLVLAFRAPWAPARSWLVVSGVGNAVLACTAIFVTMSVMVAHLLFGPAPTGAGYSVIPSLSLLFNGIAFAAAAIAPRVTGRDVAQRGLK